MNIPITSITKTTSGQWVFTWSGTGSFDVVLWGVAIATVTSPTYTYSSMNYPSLPPPLEIVVSGEYALTEIYSPRLTLQWYSETNVDHYIVQQSLDSGVTWTTISSIAANNQWVYTYSTVILKDETVYNYQVIAVDTLGNNSTPRLYTSYIVTCPAPVDVNISISYSGGNVIVSAA